MTLRPKGYIAAGDLLNRCQKPETTTERLLKLKSNNDRYSHFPGNNFTELITLQDLPLNAAV